MDSTACSWSAVSPLTERPIIRCLPPKNIVPAPHTQLAIGMGEGTAMVGGELQGDGFGRGNDGIPTETCNALRLHSVNHLEPKEKVRPGFLRQSGLILCLLPNA